MSVSEIEIMKLGINPLLFSKLLQRPPKNEVPKESIKVETPPEEKPAPPDSPNPFLKLRPRRTQEKNQQTPSNQEIIKEVVTPEIKEEKNKVVDLRKTRSSKATKRSILKTDILWVHKATGFRDKILCKRDLRDYYRTVTDEHAQKIIALSDLCKRSQIDTFTIRSSRFFAVGCLTSVRIFERHSSTYQEVKRIPERNMKLSSNLVTCLHYSNSKLYIAYLWGSHDSQVENTNPFIEIRNISGLLEAGPYYFEDPIRSIESDDNFIYIITSADVLFIHRKSLFNVARYCINLRNSINGHLLKARAYHNKTCKSYTQLTLLLTTTKEIIVMEHDAFEDKIWQSHQFVDDEPYNIISTDIVDKKVIIHRNVESKNANTTEAPNKENHPIASKVDVGSICNFNNLIGFYFIQDMSITFESTIQQVIAYKDTLFVFGYTCNKHYEVCCFKFPDLKQVWSHFSLELTGPEYYMIVDDDRLSLIKNHKDFITINISKINPSSNACRQCSINFYSIEDLDYHQKHNHVSLSRNVNVCLRESFPTTAQNQIDIKQEYW